MRLAVLYDARVHLPAFHALKAWRLAVMASSTSLFHHQVSRRHQWGLSLEYSMSVKLLTELHLEFLSLKGGCTASSESTLVKLPHCWKSHVLAQICVVSYIDKFR